MQDAVKNERNSVRRLLENTLPDYVPWFGRWRAQRNTVKDGVNFAIAGPEEDLGIIFTTFTSEGGAVVDCSIAVRLCDVTEAVQMTAALTAMATRTVGPVAQR